MATLLPLLAQMGSSTYCAVMIEKLTLDEQRFGKKSRSLSLRLENIEWVKALPRESLVFREREASLIYEISETGEELALDYPGKESASDKRPRPYDFRPRVRLANGVQLPDLTFFMIWDGILENLRVLDPNAARVLGVIFYRMAHMVDTTTCSSKWPIRIDGDLSMITLPTALHRYSSPVVPGVKTILGEISWCGMTLETFLGYNFLLALNEDVKYSYDKAGKWDGRVGLLNTVLTHLSVISLSMGKMKFAELLQRFVRGRGVGPATRDDVREALGPYLRLV